MSLVPSPFRVAALFLQESQARPSTARVAASAFKEKRLP